MIDWQAVWNQYGFFGVLFGMGVLAYIDIRRNRAKTQDATEKTTSEVIMVLAESIKSLGDHISKGNEAAARERNDNLMAIKEMSGRMTGMTDIVTKSSLSSSAILTHVHGLTDLVEKEFPAIKTDLGDVKEKATALQSSFTGALDARFEPVARLLNDVLVSVRDWDARFGAHNAQAQASNIQVLEAVKSVLTGLDVILNYIKIVPIPSQSPQSIDTTEIQTP